MLAQEVNKKVRSLIQSQETTDMALFVRTSDEDMAGNTSGTRSRMMSVGIR